MKTNIGFDNRIFLTKQEWETYLKRMPVRYIKKTKKTHCQICGEAASAENPLESSHIIGFKVGIVSFGLTPDFLDRDENIVSAHKRICNSKAEKSVSDICKILKQMKISSLPSYLSKEIQSEWRDITALS